MTTSRTRRARLLAALAGLALAVPAGVGYESWRHADYRDEVRHNDED